MSYVDSLNEKYNDLQVYLDYTIHETYPIDNDADYYSSVGTSYYIYAYWSYNHGYAGIVQHPTISITITDTDGTVGGGIVCGFETGDRCSYTFITEPDASSIDDSIYNINISQTLFFNIKGVKTDSVIEFKFFAPDFSDEIYSIYGDTSLGSPESPENYEFINVGDNTTLLVEPSDVNQFHQIPVFEVNPPVEGCTDSGTNMEEYIIGNGNQWNNGWLGPACNYNPAANVNDGSCQYGASLTCYYDAFQNQQGGIAPSLDEWYEAKGFTDEVILNKILNKDLDFKPNERTLPPIDSEHDSTYGFEEAGINFEDLSKNYILLTAPHTQRHCRHTADSTGTAGGPPDNPNCKPQDGCTGGIIKALGEVTGLPILYVEYKIDDPNKYNTLRSDPYASFYFNYGLTDQDQYFNGWQTSSDSEGVCISEFDENGNMTSNCNPYRTNVFGDIGASGGELHPFKGQIKEYVDNNPNIKLLIDIHGMAEWRNEDVCFGVNGTPTKTQQYDGPYLASNPWIPEYNEYLLSDNIYNSNNFRHFTISSTTTHINGSNLQHGLVGHKIYDNIFRTSFFNNDIYGLSYNTPYNAPSHTVAGWAANTLNIDAIQFEISGRYRCNYDDDGPGGEIPPAGDGDVPPNYADYQDNGDTRQYRIVDMFKALVELIYEVNYFYDNNYNPSWNATQQFYEGDGYCSCSHATYLDDRGFFYYSEEEITSEYAYIPEGDGYGCSDLTAFNYNPTAISCSADIDDNSCCIYCFGKTENAGGYENGLECGDLDPVPNTLQCPSGCDQCDGNPPVDCGSENNPTDAKCGDMVCSYDLCEEPDACGVCGGNNGTMDCFGNCTDDGGGCGENNNPGGGENSIGDPNICGRDGCGVCGGTRNFLTWNNGDVCNPEDPQYQSCFLGGAGYDCCTLDGFQGDVACDCDNNVYEDEYCDEDGDGDGCFDFDAVKFCGGSRSITPTPTCFNGLAGYVDNNDDTACFCTSNTVDCAGVCDGDAQFDDCGTCYCPEGSTSANAGGDCVVQEENAYMDVCGECSPDAPGTKFLCPDLDGDGYQLYTYDNDCSDENDGNGTYCDCNSNVFDHCFNCPGTNFLCESGLISPDGPDFCDGSGTSLICECGGEQPTLTCAENTDNTNICGDGTFCTQDDLGENCISPDDCGSCEGGNICAGCQDSTALNTYIYGDYYLATLDCTYKIDDDTGSYYETVNGCCEYPADDNTIITQFLLDNVGDTIDEYGEGVYALFNYGEEADTTPWDYDPTIETQLEDWYNNNSLEDWLLENYEEGDTYLEGFLNEYGGVTVNEQIEITPFVWNFIGFGFDEPALILDYANTSFNNILTSGDMIQGPSDDDGTISTIVYNQSITNWDGGDEFELQPGRGYRVWFQNPGVFMWSTDASVLPDLEIDNTCGDDTAFNYNPICGQENINCLNDGDDYYICCVGNGFSYGYQDVRYCNNSSALNYNPNLVPCQSNDNDCIFNNSDVLEYSSYGIFYENEIKFMLDFAILNGILGVSTSFNYQIESNFGLLYDGLVNYFEFTSSGIIEINIGTNELNQLPEVKIPYSIGSLTMVDTINIEGSNLSFIPSTFQNRINNESPLESLNFKFNDLSSDSFQDGDKNQYINDNSGISIATLDLSNFFTIDLSYNQFIEFPTSIMYGENNLISDLNISNNPITSIPNTINNIGSSTQFGLNFLDISYLDLPDNYQIPTQLFEDSELGYVNNGSQSSINCSNDEIKAAQHYCYRGITELDISGNLGIAWDVSGMSNSAIYTLFLNDNGYDIIPTLLSPVLRQLYINNNNLQDVQYEINNPINWYVPRSNGSAVRMPYGIARIYLENNNLIGLSKFIIGTTDYTPNDGDELGRSVNALNLSYNTELVVDGDLIDDVINYQPMFSSTLNRYYGIIVNLILRGMGLERFPNEQPDFFYVFQSDDNPYYTGGIHYIDIAENPFYCDCPSLSEVQSCNIPQWVKDGLTEGWIVGFDERDLSLCGEPELVASGCGGTLTCEQITPVIHEECEFVGCNTLYDDEANPIACEDPNPEEMSKPCQGYWDNISFCPENYGTCQTTYG